MTPELRYDKQGATGPHLDNEQLAELLDHRTGAADGHLSACAICSAEFADLQASLSLFREAGEAFAEREFKPMPRSVRLMPAMNTFYFQPAYWAAAAAVLLAIGLLPLQMHRQHAAQIAPAVAANSSAAPMESDEALLDGIDRDLSVSVPGAMQPLADPTGASTSLSSSSTSAQRTN